MGKTYNISNSSDMRRFSRDLESSIKRIAEDALKNESFEFTCPFCKRIIEVHSGKNTCRYCRKTVNVELNIHT